MTKVVKIAGESYEISLKGAAPEWEPWEFLKFKEIPTKDLIRIIKALVRGT